MRPVSGRIWIALVLIAALTGLGRAETYHLNADKGWQNVADDPQAEYLLAISTVKQQLVIGSGSDVVEALKKLKSDFPDLAGDEVDAFILAEKLYANAKWYKAATKYKLFVDSYPDSVLQPAAMERIYGIATAFLQGQKRAFLKLLKLPAFDTGEELIRYVADRSGKSPLALRALTTLAENQERKKLFKEAYFTWQEVYDRWPTGQTRQKTLLRMAQVLHASYEGTAYDASVIESAKSYYEDYNAQYPEDAARLKVPETITQITEQVAYKEYQTGFYYERTGNLAAAKRYYQNVIDGWPQSKAAQMAQARMVPDAVSPINLDSSRRMVNGTTTFLDNWFGLKPLFGAKSKSEVKE